MATQPTPVQVEVQRYRKLRIYNPEGPERPFVPGKAPLSGIIKSVNGNDWVIFPTQRGYGLPIQRASSEERIELDLTEAAFYVDVIVTGIVLREEHHARTG